MSSFIKDPDRHTRGVNAIAAVDGVGNRLRRREARKIAAMRRRDAALAMVANRAFRASSLGAIPTTGMGKIGSINTSLTSYNRPDMPTSGSGTWVPPKPRPIPGSGTSPVVDTRPTLLNPNVRPGLVAQPKGVVLTGGGTWTGPVVVNPGSGLGPNGGSVVNPIVSGGGSSGGLVTGGGGGGGGGGGMVTDPGPDGMGPDGSLVDDDGQPAVPETSSNKKYLLYAALAIGAYWLWRRSKKGT